MNQSREMSPVAQVCRTLASAEMRQRIAQALPPGVDVDRFTRVVLTGIQQNPAVAEVDDRQSIYNSAIRAASDGLVPDGREGAFVVFKKKIRDGNRDVWVTAVQWMPMVGGVIKRLAQAGISIDAQVVYENDEFEQVLGDDAAIHHKAPRLGTPRGKPIGAYAIARLPNGLVMREVMDHEQIEQVRKASKAPDSGPWAAWWTEMARKTVIRRLAKRLPIIDQGLRDTLERDDELYDFAAANAAPTDSPATAPAPEQQSGPRRPRALAAIANQSQPEPEPGEAAIDGHATRVEESPPPQHASGDDGWPTDNHF